MNTSLARTVYIAQVDQDFFDVSFRCPATEFPWRLTEARTYRHITRASLARLNHLVFCNPVPVSAHLVPYICLWVIFPPKGSRS